MNHFSRYSAIYSLIHQNRLHRELANALSELFDMRPAAIEKRLKLRNPIYSETAAYGHMGRENETVTKTFKNVDGTEKIMEVELFTWEKLDYVTKIKDAFDL